MGGRGKGCLIWPKETGLVCLVGGVRISQIATYHENLYRNSLLDLLTEKPVLSAMSSVAHPGRVEPFPSVEYLYF